MSFLANFFVAFVVCLIVFFSSFEFQLTANPLDVDVIIEGDAALGGSSHFSDDLFVVILIRLVGYHLIRFLQRTRHFFLFFLLFFRFTKFVKVLSRSNAFYYIFCVFSRAFLIDFSFFFGCRTAKRGQKY